MISHLFVVAYDTKKIPEISIVIAGYCSTKTGVYIMVTQLVEKQLNVSGNVTERRRFHRIRLQIPLFIRGTDTSGSEFLELAKTLDISCSGAKIVSPRRLQYQEILCLTVPAPLPPSPKFAECGTSPISARVRRIDRSDEIEVASVEFLRTLD